MVGIQELENSFSSSSQLRLHSLAFPNGQNAPSGFLQGSSICEVAGRVSLKFGDPVTTSRLGNSAFAA